MARPPVAFLPPQLMFLTARPAGEFPEAAVLVNRCVLPVSVATEHKDAVVV